MNFYYVILSVAKDLVDLAPRSFATLRMTPGITDTIFKKAMSPKKADQYICQLKPCLIGMEVCGGAHFRARKYIEMGHKVKIIAPQFVKPFVTGNRNDISDAQGIAEAASRPSIRTVPVKTSESQTLQNYHLIRDRLIGNKVALSNQARGILYEYNIVIPKGDCHLKLALVKVMNDSHIESLLKRQVADLYEEFIEIEDKIKVIDNELKGLAKQSEICQLLTAIPGVGPIVATSIYAVVSGAKEFKNGRQFAAWLGITPGHQQTGGPNGRKIMLGITKRGNRYLRKTLIQGARCYLINAARRKNKISKWVEQLRKEKGFNKAAVALANKIARIIWVVLVRKESFDHART